MKEEIKRKIEELEAKYGSIQFCEGNDSGQFYICVSLNVHQKRMNIRTNLSEILFSDESLRNEAMLGLLNIIPKAVENARRKGEIK